MRLNLYSKKLDYEGLDFNQSKILDVGGFIAAFPLTLSRMGLDVTLTECYDYYYGAFDDLKDYVEGEGVWNVDPTVEQDDIFFESKEDSFNLITCMAMIEHLPNSPKVLFENASRLLAEDGSFVVEVPNIAYFPNECSSSSGKTIHPPIDDVYNERTPFTGHHREYTIQDLDRVFELTGFKRDQVSTFNYSLVASNNAFRNFARKVIYRNPFTREIITALASKRSIVKANDFITGENVYGSKKKI